ncbi:hypothetical protein [Halostagnicola sp. A56]|uniref:hypothetical protein n=1 Tax=Halostagnicola sp. A56 TaxID=1495067 RepID=UPI001E45CBEB|nr:hypothetical protein [Halostagnicola sp. A56]
MMLDAPAESQISAIGQNGSPGIGTSGTPARVRSSPAGDAAAASPAIDCTSPVASRYSRTFRGSSGSALGSECPVTSATTSAGPPRRASVLNVTSTARPLAGSTVTPSESTSE